MNTMPVLPVKPGRLSPPSGEAGLKPEPTRAETSFKQQLTDASQNNDSPARLADSKEQGADELTEQITTEVEVDWQASIILGQPWLTLARGEGENINKTAVTGRQIAGSVQSGEVPPLIIPASVIGEEVLVANITNQGSLSLAQKNIVVENVNSKGHIINNLTAGKPKITEGQNQGQLHTVTTSDKQENTAATTLSYSRESTAIIKTGDKQNNTSSPIAPQAPLRDTNGSYIHSNLSEISISNKENMNNNLNSQSGEEKGKGDSGAVLHQHQNNSSKTTVADTPLIFSVNQSVPGSISTAQTGDYTSSLRLPSGAEIPHSRIVDQVINRFTMNRTLESGTVILKMYPAELGELQMKITVDRDNIRASIITQNPQVQEILDRYMSRLRDALEEQGLKLEYMDVRVNKDDNSSNNGHHFREEFNQNLNENRKTDNILSSIGIPDVQVEGAVNLALGNSHNLSVLI
jgi:hypothetical protein